MMKRIFTLLLLLLPVFAWAQTSPLDNYPPRQGHRALYGNPTAATPIDTLWWRIGIIMDSVLVAIDQGSSDAWMILSTNYADIATALTTGRTTKNVVVVPVGETGALNPTSADSNQTIFDFRNGKWKVYGTRQWAFGSVTEADSLNRIQKIIDSTRTFGKINLGRGTWTVATPLIFSTPVNIEGTTAARVRDDLSNLAGTIIKSTSETFNDTTGIVESKFQGVWLSHLSLHGNNRLNSNGYYSYRTNSPVITTLGGYGIRNSVAYNNGKDGFNIEGSDGNFFHDLEAFRNGGYGIKITDAAGNGKTFAPGQELAAGTTNTFIGGRTRVNYAGGIFNYSTKQSTLIGVEAISDTTVNFKSYNTRGTVSISQDFEFARPPRIFSGAKPHAHNMELDTDRAMTFIGGYTGSINTHSSNDSTDSGTNTTTVISADIDPMPDNYYIGYEFTNVTLDSPAVEVTDYVRATNTLTLASAIPGQTLNQKFSLKRMADVGILAKNLASSVWINHTFPEQSDSVWVSDGNYSNAIFINPIQFNPRTDIVDRDSAVTKILTIDNDSFNAHAPIEIYAKGAELLIEAIEDSLKFLGYGVKIESDSLALDLQPNPPDDDGTEGDVYLWSTISDSLYPDFRLYFDADTLNGSLRRQYIFFRASAGQPNTMILGGLTDTTRLVVSIPLELSGNTDVARFMDILATAGASAPTATLLNNRVRLYAQNDSLWATNDNAAVVNLMRGGGAGTGDIEGVTAGDGLNGGGSSGTVTLNVNPKLIGQTIAITSDSVHVKAASLDSSHITNGSIASTDIKDGEVLAADIATGAVGSAEIAADAVGNSEMADNAIREAEMNWLQVTADSVAYLANRTLEIPAAAFIGTTANGATDAVVSNYLSIKNFDTATAETLVVDHVLPRYWSSIDSINIDAGTADTGGDSVAFAVQWLGVAADGGFTGAFSTAIHDTLDMGATAHVRKILRYTQTITGTGLAANARVIWKIYRDPSISNDVAADVYIRGIRIFGKGIK